MEIKIRNTIHGYRSNWNEHTSDAGAIEIMSDKSGLSIIEKFISLFPSDPHCLLLLFCGAQFVYYLSHKKKIQTSKKGMQFDPI